MADPKDIRELRALVHARANREFPLERVDDAIARTIGGLGSEWVANREYWERCIVNEVVRRLELLERGPNG